MIVRRERAGDVTTARRVQVEAFDRAAGPGEEPVEATLLDWLRAYEGWIPALSLVAEIDSQIVGHAVCTRGTVGVAVAGPFAYAGPFSRL